MYGQRMTKHAPLHATASAGIHPNNSSPNRSAFIPYFIKSFDKANRLSATLAPTPPSLPRTLASKHPYIQSTLFWLGGEKEI